METELKAPRAEKVAVVDEVRERIGAASATILTEYRGLSVTDLQALRRALARAGGEYRIYKNSLVRRAASARGLDGLEELLTGPTALAFVSGDLSAVAKALKEFTRTNPNLVVKGALVGDGIFDAAQTSAIADLPSRDVLLSEIAGAFAAPMQRFAGLLAALPQRFAYAIAALIDERGGVVVEQSPAAAPPAQEPTAEEPSAETTLDETATATNAEAEGAEADEASTDEPAAEADEANAGASVPSAEDSSAPEAPDGAADQSAPEGTVAS